MVESLIRGEWYQFEELYHACGFQIPGMISVVGGGGKTTTILNLQKEYIKRRICHAVTTTTHMQYQNNNSFLEIESPESFFKVFEKQQTAVIGHPVQEGKMRGPSLFFLENLFEMGVTLLIEADGARHMPAKVPAAHEPVIMNKSTAVLSVYGMDALGKRIEEGCFRPKDVALFLNKSVTDILNGKDIVLMAASDKAGRKSVPAHAEYHVVLNKCDVLTDIKEARKIAEELYYKGINHIHLTSYADMNLKGYN